MRPSDFEQIKQRQIAFKELMQTEKSLGFGKSDIIPLNSTKTENENHKDNFPFLNIPSANSLD